MTKRVIIIVKGGITMRRLSAKRLSEIVTRLREEKGLTKEELGNRSGINRIMIGRIERGTFIPSIVQLVALGNVLAFDITDVFVDKDKKNSFIALRSETLNENEREGVENLFKMMLSLRQQVLLRRKFENEQINKTK
jgi:transcriptional regulator with XRE-family HTH domain